MAESEFRQPIRKVQPARTAEQARVPASSCARIDVLFGGYSLVQECTHRIERQVVVTLRRNRRGCGAEWRGDRAGTGPVRVPGPDP